MAIPCSLPVSVFRVSLLADADVASICSGVRRYITVVLSLDSERFGWRRYLLPMIVSPLGFRAVSRFHLVCGSEPTLQIWHLWPSGLLPTTPNSGVLSVNQLHCPEVVDDLNFLGRAEYLLVVFGDDPDVLGQVEGTDFRWDWIAPVNLKLRFKCRHFSQGPVPSQTFYCMH